MDWNKARLFNDKALGQNKEGEARKDRIRRQDYERKKALQVERRPHPDWQSTMVSGGSHPRIKKKRVDPVCIRRERMQADLDKARLSNDKALGQAEEGEARQNRTRG